MLLKLHYILAFKKKFRVLVEGMHLKNQQDSSVTCSHLKIIQVACEKHCTKPKLV